MSIFKISCTCFFRKIPNNKQKPGAGRQKHKVQTSNDNLEKISQLRSTESKLRIRSVPDAAGCVADICHRIPAVVSLEIKVKRLKWVNHSTTQFSNVSSNTETCTSGYV